MQEEHLLCILCPSGLRELEVKVQRCSRLMKRHFMLITHEADSRCGF